MWPTATGPSSLPERQVPVDMRPRRIHSVRSGYGPSRTTISGRRKSVNGLGDTDIISSIDELSNGPQSLPYDAMPVDLLPRMLEEYVRNPDGSIAPADMPMSLAEQLLQKISVDTGIISSTMVLSRGLIGRTILVTTTPQLIINAQFLRGYILLNPNELTGATAAGTLLQSESRGAATANLTGTSSALGVANYMEAHFFIDVTAVSGGASMDIVLQALDPASGTWADVQTLVSGVTTVGSFYASTGAVGIATDARVRWDISAGDVTFSVGYVLKNGLIGTSSGISQTIYIGGPGVSTVSGFPLLNGQSERFFLKENVELYAVANATLPMKIFEL